jgi:hypothetical protein
MGIIRADPAFGSAFGFSLPFFSPLDFLCSFFLLRFWAFRNKGSSKPRSAKKKSREK